MSEQQRVLVAIGICLGIFVAWRFFLAPPAPPKEPPAPPASASEEVKPEPHPEHGATAKAAAKAGEPTREPTTTTPVDSPGSTPVKPAVPFATRSFATPLLAGELSNRPLMLTRLELPEFRERPVGEEVPGFVSLSTGARDRQPFQAALDWQVDSKPAPTMAFEETGTSAVRMAGKSTGLDTELLMTPRAQQYGIDYLLAVKNATERSLPVRLTIELALRPVGGEEESRMQVFAGACHVDQQVERWELSDLEDGPVEVKRTATWAGLDRQYFVIAAAAGEGGSATCHVSREDKQITVRYAFRLASVAPGARWERRFALYAGPKQDEALALVHPTLTEIIDYDILGIPLGFLARPMVGLLKVFHGWVGSWGIAIMLLTLLVKIVTFPITYKSAVSMRRMQLLKPELDKLKERFPNDRERQQAEQLKLFKDKGVNPLGGCLPILLQMPIWFALYRALWTAVDLYQQSFLWLPDLTVKEPGIPFLALALGVVTFVQQKLTPMTSTGGAADTQQKIMRWVMPVFLTFIMISLPSGLVLYVFVNSLLSAVQQLAINRQMKSL